jgi:hypothetical protein
MQDFIRDYRNRKTEILMFAISVILFTLALLYLFRFWFGVYLFLFFCSTSLMAGFYKSPRWRVIVFGCFFGYVLSALIGFVFMGVA